MENQAIEKIAASLERLAIHVEDFRNFNEESGGMILPSRRERIATACLQGLLANPAIVERESSEDGSWVIRTGDLEDAAVEYADRLIGELGKPVNQPKSKTPTETPQACAERVMGFGSGDGGILHHELYFDLNQFKGMDFTDTDIKSFVLNWEARSGNSANGEVF